MPAPILIWVLEPASGRIRRQDAGLGIGCARPRSLWRPPAAEPWRQARCGRGPRHIWAVVGTHRRWWRSGGHRHGQGQVRDRGEGGVAEADQGVTDPAGELAGHGQGGSVAIYPGLHLGGEVVVGGGRASGCGGRPQTTPSAAPVVLGGTGGRGCACCRSSARSRPGRVAHDRVAVGETAGVAQLGQDGRRDQHPDPIVAVDQRPAARLAAG